MNSNRPPGMVILCNHVFPVYLWLLLKAESLRQKPQLKYIDKMTSQYHPLPLPPPSAPRLYFPVQQIQSKAGWNYFIREGEIKNKKTKKWRKDFKKVNRLIEISPKTFSNCCRKNDCCNAYKLVILRSPFQFKLYLFFNLFIYSFFKYSWTLPTFLFPRLVALYTLYIINMDVAYGCVTGAKDA